MRLLILTIVLAAQPALAAPLALPEHYASINGGWHLDAKCDFLSDADRTVFTMNLEQIHGFADGVLTTGYARHLRAVARDGLSTTCGEAELSMVLSAFADAQAFVAMLNAPSGAVSPTDVPNEVPQEA